MYDKAIWQGKYHPWVSSIYALNNMGMKTPDEGVWKLLVDAENYHQDWIERLARAAEAAVAK